MNKFYLLFLIAICSSFSNSINAQGTAQYWQLYQTIQGGTYIARDWIELQPGFSFTASGNTFEAIIDESLPFNVMYSTTQPDPSQEHNKTLPVGSIPGSFAVSPTGAATYSIPIEISPGTNGVQPSLAITYNSQTGNGMMGVGWSISGLSSITRIPATFYNDNMYDGVDLDEKDRFALDGNRLILISTNKEYGENGAEYRTETETFSVIKSYDTNGDNSPEYFKAWTKSGIEIEFGSPNGGNSRFMVGTKALFWSINKMKDSHGNFITYQYNNANSEFYIDEIEYTGNDDISPAISPYNKIKFLYENRTIDQNTAYIQGYYIKQNMLLRKIDTYNENNLFRSYRFKYFNDVTNLDVVSHLVEISEEGHNGEKLNSSIFNWGNSLLKYQWLTSSINMTSSSKKYVGDFNGDGLNDLFFAVYEEDEDMYFEHWYLYLSQSGIGFQLEDDGTMNSNYHEVIVADCDHDGDDDIVFRKSKLINGNAREVLEGNILSDGELVFYEDISEISDITEEDGVRTFANDFDGNGTIDYLLIDKNNNFKEAIGFTVYSLQRGWNNFPKDIKIVDFDGDGRLDVLAIYNSETIIYSYIVEELNFVAIYNLSFPTANYRICEGDFNGDGKTDLLTYLNGWQLYYSNGNSYIQSTGTIPLVRSIDPGESYSYFRPDIIYGYDANYNYLINDFNGDGKSDILEYFNETGNHYVYMHYSTGIGFKTEYFVENNIDFIGHGDLMLDANGDGKTELFLNRCSDGENEKIIRFHSGETSNLVNKITDGYNQSITINYKSLADPYTNFYTKETGAIFPLNDIMVPLYTVSSYLSPNGVGSTNTVTLSYKGAKIHRQGKGFLGFTEIAAIDLITYIKTTQHYNPVHSIGSNTYYISLHEYSKVELLPNELLSETTNVYDFHEYGNKRIFPYLNETTTDDYLYDTRTVASSTINTDGNQTVSWVNYYEGTGLSATWIASTQTDYSNYIDAITRTGDENILHNKPQDILLRKSHNDHNYTTFYQSTNLNYTITGNVSQKIEFYGKPKALTYNYEYFPAGTLKKTTASAEEYISRISEYEYDPKFRFIIKQKDALGNSTRWDYDDATGNVLTTINLYNNIKQYKYDGFGRLIETVLPNGKRISESINWVTEATTPVIPNAHYYRITTPEGSGEVTEFFDVLGRSLYKKSKDFEGGDIVTTTKYNIKGQVEEITTPTASGTETLITTYSYDSYSRITQEVFDDDYETTYAYDSENGKSIEITKILPEPDQDQWIKKTTDALGNLKEVEDAGGTITYKYHATHQLREITTPGSNLITIGYDEYGLQNSLDDPDAGLITYDYTPFGELETQTDAEQNQYNMVYDVLGRLVTKSGPEGGITYDYYTAGYNGNTMLKKVTGPNGIFDTYGYDEFGRIISKSVYIESGRSYTTNTKYDDFGRISEITYPSDFAVYYLYNNTYGYLSEVKRKDNDNTIWKAGAMNKYGQWVEYNFGNNLLITQKEYNDYGMLNSIKTQINDTYIQNLEYSYNNYTGNLDWRKDNTRPACTEYFGYDELNRLEYYNVNDGPDWNILYDNNNGGNISSKALIGDYTYNGSQTHAVTSISNPQGTISTASQNIEYTGFNKVSSITEDIYEIYITYGPDYQRRKSMLYEDLDLDETVYYFGNYEVHETYVDCHELHYIAGGDGLAAIYDIDDGVGKMYYILKDHLGSYHVIADENGNKVDEYSFDPWGRRRNPNDWSYSNVPTTFLFSRGFTGHEHLNDFNLINMNGRVYDPLLGRFLSPDNYIQWPDNAQSFNRYAYALNNPLKFTDPSGEFLSWTAAGMVGGLFNALGNMDNINSFSDFNRYAGVGFVSGFISQAASEVPYVGPALAGYAAGFITAYGNARIQGGSFDQSLSSGIKSGMIGTAGGILAIGAGELYGLISSYSKSERHGLVVKYTNAERPCLTIPDQVNSSIDMNLLPQSSLVFSQSYINNIIVNGNMGGYTIEMNRIVESPNTTVSEFNAFGPTPMQPINGYILEPGGPSTTASGQDRRVPADTYVVTPYSSTNHPNVYRISNAQVPADRYILIHIGNYHYNTSGCLLPGSSYSMVGGNYAVWNSTATLDQLRVLLGANNASLIIRDISLFNFNFGW